MVISKIKCRGNVGETMVDWKGKTNILAWQPS